MASEKFQVKQIPKAVRKQEVWSRRAYVDWVNHKLKAHYTNAIEFRNGAMYVQLVDSLFPGVVPMNEVKFSAHLEYDCFHNFRILEEAFKKLAIDKTIDTHVLSTGRHVESWSFLKWFKMFYDINYKDQDYDPVKARKNAYMGFGRSSKPAKAEPPVAQYSKRNGKLLCHARSKSMVFGKEIKQGRDINSEDFYKKLKKSCRSVECLYPRQNLDFGSRPISPIDFEKNEKVQRIPEKIPRSILYGKRNKDSENEDCELGSSSSTSPINDIKASVSSKSFQVAVKKDRSRGDFEHRLSKFEDVNTGPPKCLNVNAIVVNKSQTYEQYGVRITENIQIRIEGTSGVLDNIGSTDYERRQKINLMIEKFLKYQWIERKEYFQTLAEFLRKDPNNN